VFQLESRGMKDLIRRLKPDRFEDIVALVRALPSRVRSSPAWSATFIDRKHSRNDPHAPPIDYLHPSLQPSLAPTYGVILYQEQVMQIAQVLAGYTLGWRRPAAPRDGQEEARGDGQAGSIFVEGSMKNGVPEGQAAHILRPHGEIRGLRLQQVALAAYRVAVVPDRLVEGARTRFVHGGRAAPPTWTTPTRSSACLYDCRKEVGLPIPSAARESARRTSSPVVDEKTIRYGLGAIKAWAGRGRMPS
jgi:DNA polymerase-3 subunit alpha